MKKRTGKLALALAALAMLVTTIGCKDPNNGIKTVEEETKSYTVTFNTNGGSAIEAVSVDEGNTLTLPDDPTKTGYDFKGWFTDDALSAEFDATVAITEDTTLYAKWAVIEYTITYVLNDDNATNAATNPAKYTIESEAITLAEPTTTNTEKPNFSGWYSDEALKTVATGIAKGSTGNKTFYASWSDKVQYTVTFYNGTTVLATIKVVEGGTITIPSTIAVEGYTIEGWYTDADLTKPFDSTATVSADVSLYAKAVANVTVTFKNGTEVVKTESVANGATVTAPATPTKKTGYTFGGWVSGTTTLAAGATSAAITADTTFTASWTAITYSITYENIASADTNTNTATSYTIETDTITLTDPTSTTPARTFEGWYSDENYTTAVTQIAKGSTGDIVLYAKWSLTITLAANSWTDSGTTYYNRQALLNLISGSDDVTVSSSKAVKITLKGSAPEDVSGLQVVMIDNHCKEDGTYEWATLSGYVSLGDLTANEDFEIVKYVSITGTSGDTIANGGCKLSFLTGSSTTEITGNLTFDLTECSVKLVNSSAEPATGFNFESNTIDDVWPAAYVKGYGGESAVIIEDPVTSGEKSIKFICDNYNYTIWFPVPLASGEKITKISGRTNRLSDSGMGWKTLNAYIVDDSANIAITGSLTAVGTKDFQSAASSDWEDFEINVSDYTSEATTVYVGFNFGNGAASYALDDISITIE